MAELVGKMFVRRNDGGEAVGKTGERVGGDIDTTAERRFRSRPEL